MYTSKRHSTQVVSKTIIQIIVTKENIYCIEPHHSIPSIQIPKYLFPPLDYQSFKPFIVSYIPHNSYSFQSSTSGEQFKNTLIDHKNGNKIDITTDFSLQILQPEEIKQMWYDYNLVKDIGTIKYLISEETSIEASEETSELKIDSNSNAEFKLFTLRYHYCPNYKKQDDNHDRVLYGVYDHSINSNEKSHSKLSKESFIYYWLPYEYNNKFI